jgi:hypothetical protein
MLIGIDFDNTIVCYDGLFHTLALERGLIAAELPATKKAVRNNLIEQGREELWTELQGIAYGPEIGRAELFPGVLEFLREAHRCCCKTAIISHKTLHPLRGEQYDLHAAARTFLRANGFFASETGLKESDVFFELTKAAKLSRIATHGCTHFIDDLPELLSEPCFPTDVWKILFDPQKVWPEASDRVRLTSWHDAIGLIAATAQASTGTDCESVARLLTAANFPIDNNEFMPLSGGRNNRSHLLTTSDGRRSFLKCYFRHRDDPRDRLGAEFAFASYCHRFEIAAAPRPLARDNAARLGLYEFVEGRRLQAGSVDQDHVSQAIAFVRSLQAHRDSPEAATLPTASEACFDVEAHRRCIAARIDRLAAVARQRSDDEAFRSLVLERLVPTWEVIDQRLLAAPTEDPLTFARPLSHSERILSPSDFGFHNALEAADGRLRFVDFEYAGWDDPAKLVCDFFCQVDVPVPLGFAPWFTAQVAALVKYPERFMARTELLFPAYRVKWCAIVLNEFLAAGAARRQFGSGEQTSRTRLERQLALAARILGQVDEAGQ